MAADKISQRNPVLGMAAGDRDYCISQLAKNQENVQMKFFYKAIVLIFILILIVNTALFALNKFNEAVFWLVIIAIAVFAYKILPKIRK